MTKNQEPPKESTNSLPQGTGMESASNPHRKTQHYTSRKKTRIPSPEIAQSVYVYGHDQGTNQEVLCMCRYVYIAIDR